MDMSAEIGKATAALIADFTKSLLTSSYGSGKDELQKISVMYGNAFRKYIERNTKRFQKIKTILDPSTPISLLQIFEPPNFQLAKKQ